VTDAHAGLGCNHRQCPHLSATQANGMLNLLKVRSHSAEHHAEL
jgi:type III secretory pathway lipoprotein EscJ